MLLLLLSTASCKKFLDEKPDKKLVVPATLADLQAILDNINMLVVNDPYSDELGSDNMYLSTSYWQTLPDYDRGVYTWEKNNSLVPNTNEWSLIYTKVYSANTVLEGLENITRTAQNRAEWDNLQGQALMLRGKAFLNIVQVWSLAYDAATADTDLGIPLRLSTDFAETSVRPTVRQTYDRIIADLTAAVPLLPQRGAGITRSCKAAAYGFLARTCLSMRQYAKAGLYADSSLQINSSLLNYNTLNASATYTMPVPAANPEVNILTTSYNAALNISNARVDTLLYNSYSSNDYRKTVFFKTNTDGTVNFRGTYTGTTGNFAGIASDEMYLVRGEAYARAGNTSAALADLNTLMKMRFKTGTFVPFTANSAAEALDIILKERRKELLFRGLRWTDIKRLNKEGAGIIQKRVINNQVYTLPPNDLRYALMIPEYVINISGMPQNPR